MKYALPLLLLFAAGCSTVNGLCRDGRTVCEAGIKATQKSVDKQQGNSIGFAIAEQNRIMQSGQDMQQALAGL